MMLPLRETKTCSPFWHEVVMLFHMAVEEIVLEQ